MPKAITRGQINSSASQKLNLPRLLFADRQKFISSGQVSGQQNAESTVETAS